MVTEELTSDIAEKKKKIGEKYSYKFIDYLISDTKVANDEVLNNFWDLILFVIPKFQNF